MNSLCLFIFDYLRVERDDVMLFIVGVKQNQFIKLSCTISKFD